MVKRVENSSFQVKYLGLAPPKSHDVQFDLLLSIIGKVTNLNVQITHTTDDADLVICYPYVVGTLGYKLAWIKNFIRARIGMVTISTKDCLRKMLGVAKKPILFVSHENLDRPYWWNMIGKFLIESDIPRLTFWPKAIDPLGARFPYWYNYVDWVEYPRKNFYQRFGRLYKVEELMRPLEKDSLSRKNKAVAISSHLDYPRKTLLNNVMLVIQTDCYGAAGKKFSGSKLSLMQQYKYAFCPENSTGYGYDTEKLPEAWVAGCIPVGISINPFSDFNPKVVLHETSGPEECYNQPLLLKTPCLKEIEDYIRGIL